MCLNGAHQCDEFPKKTPCVNQIRVWLKYVSFFLFFNILSLTTSVWLRVILNFIYEILSTHYFDFIYTSEWTTVDGQLIQSLQLCWNNHIICCLLQRRHKQEVVEDFPVLSPLIVKPASWIDYCSSHQCLMLFCLQLYCLLYFVQKQCWHDNSSFWCRHVYRSKIFSICSETAGYHTLTM